MAAKKVSTNEKFTNSLINKIEENPHTEGLVIDIELLEKILMQAKHDYYNTDKQLISDKTYDILETILKERKPNSKVLTTIAAPIIDPDQAVKLPYFMGSMDKIKPGEKILTKWLADHPGSLHISEKLDGLSSLLIIEPNDKMILYKHGDKNEGQIITKLLDNINIGKLNKKEIKRILEKEKHIALRGEIIIKKDIYNDKYTKSYAFARGVVSGQVNNKNPDPNIVKDMQIIFYELICPSGLKFEDQFAKLEQLGVNVAKYNIYPSITESQLPEILMEFKKQSDYDIDGIILNDNTKPHKRVTSGFPKYAMAFKMPLDDQKAITKVINVEYNISKHGTLAPRIMYEPKTIKGAVHQYTSGFNLKYIIDNNIGPGTEIEIIKSGDVIPYIYRIIKSSDTPQMPPANLNWHWNATHVDAIVDDMESNQDVNSKKIVAFFATMKIAGVGEGNVAKLVNAGYNEVKTILELTPDVIAQIDGFQLKSATNLYNSVQKVISDSQPLERVMMASGVFAIGLGEKKFKMILDAIPDFLAKWKKDKITKDDIINIDGFSGKTADIFINGMPKFMEWMEIHPMIKLESINISKKSGDTTNNKFANMIVVFTGFRNDNMQQTIELGGGKVGSSISGKTTIIIAKDPNENSSKLSKAHELGIKIMSLDDFTKTYGPF